MAIALSSATSLARKAAIVRAPQHPASGLRRGRRYYRGIKLLTLLLCALPFPALAGLPEVIAAARGQVGVTTVYDPSYVGLAFPAGDVAPDRGVCTDVVIRALRAGAGIDLQLAVNRDMKAHFAQYPKIWGAKTTDRNIDHRRVPNLQTLLVRMGAELPISSNAADFSAGDIVSFMLPGNLPHIAIVSDRRGADAPMILHNIGRGAEEEDSLFEYPITGHYRLSAAALSRLRPLGTP